MTERVVVFMDYQNVHGWARRQFFSHGSDPSDGHVDVLRVGQHLAARRKRESELAEVRVYRGRPNPEHQPGAARANDKQADAWSRSSLVTVVRRNLKYPPDYPDRPAQEKGIDVAIACDMVHYAHTRGDIDCLILFSSDNDLLPALELINEDTSMHVEVAAWQKGNRLRFDGSGLPWCHNINEEQFRTLEDRCDYAAAPAPFPKGLIPKQFR